MLDIRRRTFTALAAAGLLTAGLVGTAHAADWPASNDRIRLVVPFNPGGSADRLARGLASFLPEQLNDVRVNVVNKPGGSGSLGAAWFLQQPDDGSYFLVMQATPYLANNILVMDAPFKWEDFDFINAQWSDYPLLMSGKNSKFQTLEQLIDAMKSAEPGTIKTAVVPASGSHITSVILLDKLGIPQDRIRWVTYDGGGPARASLLGGHVDWRVSAAQGSLTIQDQITPLAVFRKTKAKEWDAPPVNDVLKAKYGVTVPLVGGNVIAVIAHKSFKEKHPERYARFVEAYKATLESKGAQRWFPRSDIGNDWVGPEETSASLNEEFQALKQYSDVVRK
ncbi:MAG: tripartite tricarboxylate transporter substrate-binding protein [Acetobacterales bacterium]